jgi:signal transduction histidine kinase
LALIKRIGLKRAQAADIAAEIYKRNVELAETNKTLSLLQRINSLFMHSDKSTKELCVDLCHAIINTKSYPYVALYGPSEGGNLVCYGESKHDDAIAAPRLNIIPAEIMDEDGFKSVKIGEGGVRTVVMRKLQTVHLAPVFLVFGLGEILSDADYQTDKALLERMADAVGVIIDAKYLTEENVKVLAKLKLTNAKLKALDVAKDEFISMASHQLRTPLTSIKGYLSMMIEGDSGELNETQALYANQAFQSSQRMLYLIADLLNVSRIQTGKFRIDRSPVDMPKVIAEELDQLSELADARKVTLEYKGLNKAPLLSLDTTKTRQVIMNLSDNALYYTPSGGKVTVKFARGKSCYEFRVIDNGIGVPEEAKKSLFQKFFRSTNAQSMRPDGTGIGLFMVKKVVDLQGCKLFFSSEEGKGSVFGFDIPDDLRSSKA